MPYDDIRFSAWDDPDEDENDQPNVGPDEDDDMFTYYDEYAGVDFDWEFLAEHECRTCGKEVTYVDENGDCSWCRMVNAG